MLYRSIASKVSRRMSPLVFASGGLPVVGCGGRLPFDQASNVKACMCASMIGRFAADWYLAASPGRSDWHPIRAPKSPNAKNVLIMGIVAHGCGFVIVMAPT